MTRTEQKDLLQICQQRERVARAEAVSVGTRREANFEAQLARVYSFDEDAVWQAAYKAVKEVTRQSNEQVAAQCRQLGIPRWVQPEISLSYWYGATESGKS